MPPPPPPPPGGPPPPPPPRPPPPPPPPGGTPPPPPPRPPPPPPPPPVPQPPPRPCARSARPSRPHSPPRLSASSRRSRGLSSAPSGELAAIPPVFRASRRMTTSVRIPKVSAEINLLDLLGPEHRVQRCSSPPSGDELPERSTEGELRRRLPPAAARPVGRRPSRTDRPRPMSPCQPSCSQRSRRSSAPPKGFQATSTTRTVETIKGFVADLRLGVVLPLLSLLAPHASSTGGSMDGLFLASDGRRRRRTSRGIDLYSDTHRRRRVPGVGLGRLGELNAFACLARGRTAATAPPAGTAPAGAGAEVRRPSTLLQLVGQPH